MKFEFIIFDFDGTLLDTSEGLFLSVRHTLKTMGLNDIPEETMRAFVGPPIRESLQKYFSLDDITADEATEIFRNRYKSVDMFFAKPYDGIYDLMRDLKSAGIHIALATNKRHDYTLELMEHFKFTPYFDIIHGSDNLYKKTKTDIINRCLKDAGISHPSKAVVVGDTRIDAIGAECAGTSFIGVSFGFGFRTERDIEQYPHIGLAHDARQLARLLL